MEYVTTRDLRGIRYPAEQVILQGLAPDGGLFFPSSLPVWEEGELASMAGLSYPELAARILERFFDCFAPRDLLEDAKAAYGPDRFPEGACEVRPVGGDGLFALELWHGPTCAFKDMALQLMPRLLSRALRQSGETRTALIATATSGDTGKAALEGFRDVPGIRIKVYYPKGGVSLTQELQMITQRGENVSVSAVRGNFDDAQSAVKAMFADPRVTARLDGCGTFLTSANSINFARLAPQTVYYVYAYLCLVERGVVRLGETVDVTVPSGNFGNVLSAYIAKRMGLPLGRLVVASNRNRVLSDFLRTGVYDCDRDFYLTSSPSMDILRSSNLERLLFLAAGPDRTAAWMRELAECGRFAVPQELLSALQADFAGVWADEDLTARTIAETFDQDAYLMDTHTAVGFAAARQYRREAGGDRPMLVASTASPFKFPRAVLRAVAGEAPDDDFAAAEALSRACGQPVPQGLRDLRELPVRFGTVVEREEIAQDLCRFAQR